MINDGDGADAGVLPVYCEYAATGATSGQLVTGGLVIDLGAYGFSNGTGVAMAPDGQSLYFVSGVNEAQPQTIVQIDLGTKNPIGFQHVSKSQFMKRKA